MTSPGQTQHCPGCAEGRPHVSQDQGLRILEQRAERREVRIPEGWEACTCYGGFHVPAEEGVHHG